MKIELCKHGKVDWSCLYTIQDVEELYNKLMSILTPLYDKCLPLSLRRENKVKIRRPWITKSLFKCMNKKNKLYKRYLHNNEQRFKSYRNRLNLHLKKAKKSYY